jgi:hypothetical protein
MIKKFLLVSFFLSLLCSYSFAQQSIPKDTLITLERDPGYFGQIGTYPCPFYKLTIFADRKVQLEPKEYCKEKILIGKIIESRISREQVKQIISEFEKIDFFSLKSTSENNGNSPGECPQYGTDASTAFTSIIINGKTKRVEHYHGCSGNESLSKLTALKNKIDEIVNIKQWFDCHLGKNRINLSNKNNQQ